MRNYYVYLILLMSMETFANNLNVNLLNYNPPSNKQGISDRNNRVLSDKRYSVLRDKLSIGIQKYNYYWREAENSSISSKAPQVCKKGYLLFPKNKKQKKSLGFHNYHCYSKKFITNWKKRFRKNAEYDIQIAIVLWTAPEAYIDKGCEGFYFPLQKKRLKGGCYPTPQHYDDYEDWIRFTARVFGKYIDHYIVWNEVSSTNWADISTTKYPKKKIMKNLNFHMKRSFETYSTLLEKTITSVNQLDKKCLNHKGKCKNFIYLSLTHDWYSKKIKIRNDKKDSIHIDWRNMNLLDYLWNKFALKYDWSLVVHPYGDVYSKNRHALRFSTLSDLSKYQKNQINSYSKKTRNWLSYPQSRLFASEQNVAGKVKANGWKEKAKYICESYDVSIKSPEIIAITHNHFQDNVINKKANPTIHTMLPAAVKKDLSDASKYETFQAYESTTPLTWNKKSNHYCCKKHNLGCK